MMLQASLKTIPNWQRFSIRFRYGTKNSEKVWDPKIESEIRKKWENSKLYEFHSDADGYTIDTPPPYPSGRPWHIGAAAHYAQIDMICKNCPHEREECLLSNGN